MKNVQEIQVVDTEGVDQAPAKDFIKLMVRDIQWKLETRRSFGWTILILLLLQNVAVFGLVFMAFRDGRLPDLQIILGVIVTATLGETVAAVKIVVTWLFKDIDYDVKVPK